MAGSMNRLHDLLPRIIHELDEELPVGVLGLDNWGYITMGPDRNPETVLNDGWGLLLPNYYYYMPPAFTTHATTIYVVDCLLALRPGLRQTLRNRIGVEVVL